MALTAVHTAMHLEEHKNVHPFFSKPTRVQVPEPEPDPEPNANDTTANLDDLNHDPEYGLQNTTLQPAKTQKKRTRRTAHTNNQPSLDSFARRPAVESDVKPYTACPADPSLEEDLNLGRRKRRKTASPKSSVDLVDAAQASRDPTRDWQQQLQAEAALVTQDVVHGPADTLVTNTPKDEGPGAPLPQVIEDALLDAVPESSLPQAAENCSRPATPSAAGQHAVETSNKKSSPEPVDPTPTKVTPKKQIKITKSGKLVSSPPKPESSIATTSKRRGRPRKAAKKTNLSSTITIIKYGSDGASRSSIGQKIETILNSDRSASKQTVVVLPKPTGPPKTPHPFFTGKAGQKKAEVSAKPEAERRPVTPRKSAVTPGKLRAERRREQDNEPAPAFGVSSKSNRLAKQSGLNEPSWPSRETAHVRNMDSESVMQPQIASQPAGMTLKPAKLKRNVYTFPAEEEVTARLTQQLSENLKLGTEPAELDFAPPEDVRLPTRLLTTGVDIQHKVRAQIRAPLETLADRHYAKTHPAITTLFDEIEHNLTPFDEGRCETQAWVHKYKPERADHVLQSGKEAFVLKDWLKNLTVMSVGAVQDPSKTTALLDAKKPPRKKRKTTVDDFIVSDDDDDDEEMIELGRHDGAAPHEFPSLRRPRWTRNKNVVLLSGPHGCGKSATVYAVAKELDFEVFELNSSVRRSGKDIQDKVGDMTANHLVNHQRDDLPAKTKPASVVAADDTDNERMTTEFQKDLDSGRQGTMTSFFTAKPTMKPKPKPKPKVQVVVQSPAKVRSIPAAQAMLPIAHASRKSQKQSLILIEEADILFEEDQNFWAQVIKLAAQSKRPIVITCNDELQIPTQVLPIAAILRLTPPPINLATDYMLALAGREGHILQRQAISDLYKSKDQDLRASITELNFWCQMSVGDKKGGLEWMYQRWPPGKDVDAYGRLLRVASEDTYQSGMGWLSHNVFETKSNVVFDKEEELLKEVWGDWGISPVSWSALVNPSGKPADSDQDTKFAQLSELDHLAVFSEALSASDVYCHIGLPAYENMHDQPIDPTLPSVSDKERLSYTLSSPLLQADSRTDFLNLDTSFAAQTHLLLHRTYPDLAHQPVDPPSTSAIVEQFYTHQILQHKARKPTNRTLTRSDCAAAFDVLASPPDQDMQLDYRSSYILTPSSFDRQFCIITLDIAPYVRSIVAHEQILEAQRIRLGSLLSEGGRAKRQRTTRASRTAMEGGERKTKRKERWFHRDLNFELVMGTAGNSWAALGWKDEHEGDGGSVTASMTGTQQSESLAETEQSMGRVQEMIVDAED